MNDDERAGLKPVLTKWAVNLIWSACVIHKGVTYSHNYQSTAKEVRHRDENGGTRGTKCDRGGRGADRAAAGGGLVDLDVAKAHLRPLRSIRHGVRAGRRELLGVGIWRRTPAAEVRDFRRPADDVVVESALRAVDRLREVQRDADSACVLETWGQALNNCVFAAIYTKRSICLFRVKSICQLILLLRGYCALRRI